MPVFFFFLFSYVMKYFLTLSALRACLLFALYRIETLDGKIRQVEKI